MESVRHDSSLLNESGFLKELASLDEGLLTQRRSPRAAVEPSVANQYEPLPDVPAPIRTTPPGMFVDEPAPEPPAAVELRDSPPIFGQLAAVAMFVLMMGVGAAGAALVFHDQVARILSNW